MDLIPYSRQSITEEDISMVVKIMNSDFVTQGPQIPLFEEKLKEYFGVSHAVACSSGTSALHLAYAASGINMDSLGIVPAITFSATANAFRYFDAKVQFCDVDPESGLISIDSMEECISGVSEEQREKINAVTPVSFAGSVPNLAHCKEIASAKNFLLIEDASHSPGAWHEDISGQKTFSLDGNNALASTISFHPVKHICCGEGGAVLTNDPILAEKASTLRSHGINRPFKDCDEKPWFYEQNDLGWNYRLTDIQAALGISQLHKLDTFLSKRRKLAKRYDRLLSETPFKNHIARPLYENGHAWHLYIIRFFDKSLRNSAYKFLKEKNILSQVHYIPVYKHPYYRDLLGEINLPGAESFFERCLSIPLYPDLKEEDQDRVVDTLEQFLSKE